MRSRSRWNGVRSGLSGSSTRRRAGYDRVACGERNSSSQAAMRSWKVAVAGTPPSLSGGAQLYVRVVLERLAHCALDLAQGARLGLGGFVERLRQPFDHK